MASLCLLIGVIGVCLCRNEAWSSLHSVKVVPERARMITRKKKTRKTEKHPEKHQERTRNIQEQQGNTPTARQSRN